MKTKKIHILLIAALMFLPFMSNAQWNMVRNDEYNTFNKVFAVTPTTAFVIGNEPFYYDCFLLRTNDGGASWDSFSLNTVNDTFQLRELFFLNANTGFTGGIKNSMQVLLKTTDNGNNWMEVTPNPASANPIVSVHFVNLLYGFATDGASLYKTRNGGNSWTVDVPSFTISDLQFFDDKNGYASGMDALGQKGVVMKTADGGQTWNTVLHITNPFVFVNQLDKLDFVNEYIGFTTQQYNTNQVYRTQDGGSSWDTITIAQIWGIIDFDFKSAREGHVLSSNGEIFFTADGGQNWTLEYAAPWGFYGPSVFYNSFSFVENTGFVVGSNGLIKKYTANISVGIEEINETISAYPNPLSGSGNLVIKTPVLSEATNLQIINACGQMVFQRKLETDSNSFAVSGLNLAPGIYYLSLQTKETRNTGKLIVVR